MSETTEQVQQVTITQADAAKRYGVSDRTLNRWRHAGLIAGKRVGGLMLLRVKDLDEVTGNETEK